MTMASQRYAKANNLKCPDYDSSKPTTWTLYEDMNALYSDVEIGYTLKVDLEAPVHLHDFFADYPLTPEKQIVPEEWLSLYNERLVHDKEVGGGKYTTGEKLVQTLYPKKNYVVNYRALQLYMKLVIKVTKIHGGLKFRQSPWMKEYIEENIRKRKIAKATGMSLGLCIIRRLVSSPLFVGFKVFERGITAVHMLKSTVTLNKPIYVGQAILDISKAMMFNFWYGYIKPRYGEKASLLYTDTDSLIMWIETEDIYKDRAERPDIFDLNYSGDLFLIKDKTKGDPIGKSVCLKPKMYSVLPAGHDPKTPDDPDSEDPKRSMASRRQRVLKNAWLRGNFDMISS
ncbi:unnamed protein product [Rhizophagus irregularis]|nr:unnamed protein product [Rhizophagus irregularis]